MAKFDFKKVDWKRFLTDCLFALLGGLSYSISLSMFVVNANFAPGGITGLSVMVHHFLPQMPLGVLTLLLNIPIALISLKSLGKGFLIKSLSVMALWAVCVDVIGPLIPPYSGDPILACVFGGVFFGLALSLVYMRGFSTGGTDFICMPLKKKFPHMSFGILNLFIDGSIILLGGLVFGNIDAVLRGAVMTIASTTITDKLIYGSHSGKRLVIISDKGLAIADAIMEKAKRGVTILDSTGAYSRKHHELLICACSRAEVYRIKRICYEVDKNVLIMIGSNDEVYGEGFLSPED